MVNQKIYIGVDNCILNISETFINNKLNTNKTINDLKDLEYKSIDSNTSRRDMIEFTYTRTFWDNVKINEIFKKRYKEIKKNIVFITSREYDIGFRINTFTNHVRARLQKELQDEVFVMSITDKKIMDLSDGIQIDNNLFNLDTNSKIKICLTNLLETPYNNIGLINYPMNLDDLYMANDMNDVFDIIHWISKI